LGREFNSEATMLFGNNFMQEVVQSYNAYVGHNSQCSSGSASDCSLREPVNW